MERANQRISVSVVLSSILLKTADGWTSTTSMRDEVSAVARAKRPKLLQRDDTSVGLFFGNAEQFVRGAYEQLSLCGDDG